MIFFNPQNEHIPALKALWKEAFGDDDAYIDLFFRDMFKPENMAAFSDEGRITAMAALLPCRLVLAKGTANESCRKISYLYAMAVAKDMRGKGVGLEFLSKAAEYCKSRGDGGIALLPSDSGLTAFYKKAGYKPAFTDVPSKTDFIAYDEYYLSHIRNISAMENEEGGENETQPSKTNAVCGMYLALLPAPPFRAYMKYPMD